jgi:hypothetical protein
MKTAEIFVGILFLGIGLFSFLAGTMNWNWFFQTVNASIFLRWFGRKGARIFYSIIGLMIFFIGFMFLSGKMS